MNEEGEEEQEEPLGGGEHGDSVSEEDESDQNEGESSSEEPKHAAIFQTHNPYKNQLPAPLPRRRGRPSK